MVTSGLVAGGLQLYTEKMAREFLNAWVHSEAVAIQEGNLLTSLTKNQRMLLSSDVVDGVALLRAPEAIRGPTAEILVELGRAFEVDSRFLPQSPGHIEVKWVGTFQVIATYRLPEDPQLVVAFLAKLRSAPWLAASFLAVLGAAASLTLILVYRTLAAEHALRLRVVGLALSDLVEDRTLSEDATTSIPGLSKTWDALRSRLEGLKAQVAKQTRLAAVARTTQALAHDVRKPFSMFQSIIQIVEGTEDPNEVREVLKATLPEVDQAMASVEGLIQDVMQIGNEPELMRDDVTLESLIETALAEIFRVYPDADVSLEYELSHRHAVSVDVQRVGRVFANILGNAVQAMRFAGRIRVRSRDKEGFVEVGLANEGSFVTQADFPKLFEAFFTSGKKGGTGLGLAITKALVEAHGGSIHCESEKSDAYPTGRVEFIFTLPTGKGVSAGRLPALPHSSREIQTALAAARMAKSRQAAGGPDPREYEIEGQILGRLTHEPLRMSVLVVEDETLYRNVILSHLQRSESLASKTTLVFTSNTKEALAFVESHSPRLVIVDVNLGTSSTNGLDLVKTLRDEGFTGHICVHSNRFLLEDNKAALAAGADTVLPKPLGRAQFLTLVLASLPTQVKRLAEPSQPSLLSVAVLEDSLTMRIGWKKKLEQHTRFFSFAGTREFFDAFNRDPHALAALDVVVTDYNFSSGDPHDGGTFARALRENGYRGLILRASCDSDFGPDIDALFDGDVGKLALDWPAFKAAVESASSRRRLA